MPFHLLGGKRVRPDPLEVRGNSIYRWKIGEAEASLLEGDCVLVHEGNRVAADSVLLVVDGPIGRVRSRVVIAGMKGKGTKQAQPQAFTFMSLSDPKIVAPMLRTAAGEAFAAVAVPSGGDIDRCPLVPWSSRFSIPSR